MEKVTYSDEINLKECINIIKRQKIFIIVITALIVSMSFILNNKPIKYTGSISFEIGYVTFIPFQSINLNLPKDAIDKLFLRKLEVDQPSSIILYIESSLDGKQTKSFIDNMNIKFTYAEMNKNDVEKVLEQIKSLIMEREKSLYKKFEKSGLTIFPTKQIGKVNIVSSENENKKLMMKKLITGFVMGLIISIILAMFFDKLKEKKAIT